MFAFPLGGFHPLPLLYISICEMGARLKVGQLPVTMNKDINAMWQSPRGAAEAGCLPSANMNSEGTCKQVPPLHNQSLLP